MWGSGTRDGEGLRGGQNTRGIAPDVTSNDLERPRPRLFGKVLVHALTLMTGRLGPERAEHLSEVTQ